MTRKKSPKSLGQLILEKRKAIQLTQRQAASRIRKPDGKPISAVYLNDIEHDRRSPSSDHLIKQFAKALDIPMEVLYLATRRIPPTYVSTHSSDDEKKVIHAFEAFQAALR
jgi:transcriptional regulator with XRE-family HTH domain